MSQCWCMQHMKRYQDHLTLVFTNPIYALFLKLCPWQKGAKESKLSALNIHKVTCWPARFICGE